LSCFFVLANDRIGRERPSAVRQRSGTACRVAVRYIRGKGPRSAFRARSCLARQVTTLSQNMTFVREAAKVGKSPFHDIGARRGMRPSAVIKGGEPTFAASRTNGSGAQRADVTASLQRLPRASGIDWLRASPSSSVSIDLFEPIYFMDSPYTSWTDSPHRSALKLRDGGSPVVVCVKEGVRII